MRFGTYYVDTWIEGGTLDFFCPVCQEVDQIRVLVQVTHSPVECKVCGKRFQVDTRVKVVPE